MSQGIASKNKQNFFFLSSIQIASIGIPSLAIGYFLSQQYGAGVAIPSIIVGNLILWLIGIAVITSTKQTNLNGIQNIRNFIGTFGSFLFSIFLLAAFLDWFSFQINNTVTTFNDLITLPESMGKNGMIRIGTALGLLSALFSIGGIRVLKWISVFSLPFLISYFLYSVTQSNIHFSTPINWGLSLSAILVVILSFLPGTICLPTFFRYSASLANSYLALTILISTFTLLQCGAILLEFNSHSYGILIQNWQTQSTFQIYLFLLFNFLICICNNLMNIYFASACYETFSPRFYGMKGHAIIGLMGTATYAFIQISENIQFLINLLGCYILNLTVVLLIAFLLRLMVKHSSKSLENGINCTAWIIGCFAGTISKLQNPGDGLDYLFVAIGVSILFFLIVIFLEETIKAIRDLRLERLKK
jgi:hypothetical protein